MTRPVRRVGTWQMSAVELARVVAAHYGWRGGAGGWIYDDRGAPIVQGWQGLAALLERRGVLRVGVGVNWRRAPHTASWRLGSVRALERRARRQAAALRRYGIDAGWRDLLPADESLSGRG